MKVRILRTIGNRVNLLHSGTVIEVRKLPQITLTPAYQVTEDGPHAGIEIPFHCCIVLPEEKTYTDAEYTAVHQELLRKREEVTFLMESKAKLTEAIGRQEDAYGRICDRLRRANTSINRYAVELYNEREEKALLLQTIEKEIDAQKPVALPKKQVDALDVLKHGFGLSNYDIITSLAIRSWSEDKANYFNNIFDINRNKLVIALANGYTVEPEQTPEEKLLNYFNLATPKGWKFSGDANDPVYIERHAIRTTCSILGKEIDGINSKQ